MPDGAPHPAGRRIRRRRLSCRGGGRPAPSRPPPRTEPPATAASAAVPTAAAVAAASVCPPLLPPPSPPAPPFRAFTVHAPLWPPRVRGVGAAVHHRCCRCCYRCCGRPPSPPLPVVRRLKEAELRVCCCGEGQGWPAPSWLLSPSGALVPQERTAAGGLQTGHRGCRRHTRVGMLGVGGARRPPPLWPSGSVRGAPQGWFPLRPATAAAAATSVVAAAVTLPRTCGWLPADSGGGGHRCRRWGGGAPSAATVWPFGGGAD